MKVHEGYEAVAGMERESVDDALDWAAEKRRHGGVLRMLLEEAGRACGRPRLIWWIRRPRTRCFRRWANGAVRRVALEVARTDSAYDFQVVVAGAREAFRGAAEVGDGRAMFELGLLEDSLGDGQEAEEWYRRAIDAGQVEAAGRLGRLLWVELGETREAEIFLEAAAEAGDRAAATLLGRLLQDRSAKWLTAGAGMRYQDGDGFDFIDDHE